MLIIYLGFQLTELSALPVVLLVLASLFLLYKLKTFFIKKKMVKRYVVKRPRAQHRAANVLTWTAVFTIIGSLLWFIFLAKDRTTGALYGIPIYIIMAMGVMYRLKRWK